MKKKNKTQKPFLLLLLLSFLAFFGNLEKRVRNVIRVPKTRRRRHRNTASKNRIRRTRARAQK